MFCEIFSPSWHVLETFQGKYENNFPLFILLNIFLQSLYNPDKQRFFAELPRLFTRSPKKFLDKIFISIRVRRKIPTLFLKKHGKTIPRRYQQLVRYSYNIAGKTLSFSLEMLINTKWTKNQYMKLSDLSNYQMLYQIVWFISQFSLVFSYKILKMFLQ